MIETEDQRRWWFATHPEYSWSRRGIRSRGGVDPEEVDKYVDEALKYETGAVADLLKSVKRNFGTESQDADKDRYEQYKDDLAKWNEAIEADKRGIEPDPHTLLDLFPYRRFVTSPVQAFKYALRRMAQGQVLNATKKAGRRWKVGDDPLTPTLRGIEPSWTTQARRTWKNEAAKEAAVEKWGVENVKRMKRGLAPQRTNLDTGMTESKELHHTPIPQRDEGKEFIKVWPDEHAAMDPYRRLKKR